MSVMIKIGS